MNYFSHYLLLPDKHDDYHVLGCILPDLIRDSKPNSISVAQRINNNKDWETISLARGMNHHVTVDEKFHNSQFFKLIVKDFSKKLRDSPTISLNKYTYFFTHILLELTIDHCLIIQYPNELQRFYSSLENVVLEKIKPFFVNQLPKNDFELFETKFRTFKENKFLYDYESVNNVLDFTSYVFTKVCNLSIEKDEKNEYLSLIHSDLIPLIEKNARNLFKELQTDL